MSQLQKNDSDEPLLECMSEFELAELKQSFALFDSTGELLIPGSQVVRAIGMLTCSPKEHELAEAMKIWGIEHSDLVGFQAYVELVNCLMPFDERIRLVQCLQVMSLDPNFISKDLLKRCLLSFGSAMPADEIDIMLAGVRADSDGNISIEELADFLIS